ncbi:hypothetical protein AALB39_04125 [Lachnospiraceae bacterium 54-53]
MNKEVYEKYKALGAATLIDEEASFEKVYLNTSKEGVLYKPVHYGLYSCFTVMTQHTYGTRDELLFILGVMSSHRNNMETDTHEFYKEPTNNRISAIEMALIDELNEMKRIGKITGINVTADTAEEAYNKYFDHSSQFLTGNYFYWYRIGKLLFHECELVVESE